MFTYFLIGLLIVLNTISIIVFLRMSKPDLTKADIQSALTELHIREQTKFDMYVHRSIFTAGIHALFVNKGYNITFTEVEELYDKLGSSNEVVYEITKRHHKL